ncbi:hypothetical protein [Methanosarcina sp. MTP4]|uniref:hypothetical protein n=1 Tax=Methanosarcina sp. MTP4 TaxID=1434100 RepID=UPI000A6AFA24|nr:hypothetical protein [Methanosarcina sp. MTP4]
MRLGLEEGSCPPSGGGRIERKKGKESKEAIGRVEVEKQERRKHHERERKNE